MGGAKPPGGITTIIGILIIDIIVSATLGPTGTTGTAGVAGVGGGGGAGTGSGGEGRATTFGGSVLGVVGLGLGPGAERVPAGVRVAGVSVGGLSGISVGSTGWEGSVIEP